MFCLMSHIIVWADQPVKEACQFIRKTLTSIECRAIIATEDSLVGDTSMKRFCIVVVGDRAM